MLQYIKAERLSLKDSSEFNEAWLRDRIVDDPSILGLGDLEVRDVERKQPGTGRLDLLLRHPDTGKRYEVELMLGATDESHIMRCLEYWDIERKRYPQYDHCAVIAAEDITSRFLNITGLFNGFIPLIALKLNALRINDQVVLNFIKVLDEVRLGDEEVVGPFEPPANREFWEKKSSMDSLAIVDKCLDILHEINPNLALKYNKYYIGLIEDKIVNNFIALRPKIGFVRAQVKLEDIETWAKKLDEAGLDVLEGGRADGRLNFRLTKKDLEEHRDLLRQVFEDSYIA